MKKVKKVGDMTVNQLKVIIETSLSKTLEQGLVVSKCPVCGDEGYISDPITGNKIACFCLTSSMVLCVKNPPDLFA